MSNAAQQINALKRLQNLLEAIGRTRKGWAHDEAKEARTRFVQDRAMDRRYAERLREALKAVLAAGFTVPDAWLSADYFGDGCGLTQRFLPDKSQLWEYRPHGVDAAELRRIVLQIEAEILKLESAPAADLSDDSGEAVAHSDDFRSVNWFGNLYTFSQSQAACVKVWLDHWQRGVPEVGDSHVLEAADINGSRLDALFRDSEAWGRMIVQGNRKGTHRLAPPV